MKKLKLNFVPLSLQDQDLTVYRKIVPHSSEEKTDNDYRIKLPRREGDEEWSLFDVSLANKEGYSKYSCSFQLNPVLSVYYIYQNLIALLKNNNSKPAFNLPVKEFSRKEVCFVVEEFKEGISEIITKPYYLKESKLFGFLLEHKFSLKDRQQFNRKTQILSYSLDKLGKPNVYFYKDKKREIDGFVKNTFLPLLARSNLAVDNELTDLSADKLDLKSYIVGNGNTARSQFVGIKSNGIESGTSV